MVRQKYAAPLPLDGLSFRIAILSPGSLDDILHMTLEVRSLEESDLDYEAISYCWSQGIGDTIEDTWDFEVKCDEVTIKVPRNLGRALRRLRYRDRQRRLWMDSICINQQNVEEKNCQVARMGRIFATATRVVVWLGEQDENTASAYGTIRLLNKAASILAKQDEAVIWRRLLTKQVSEVAGLWPVTRNEIQVMADLLQRAWFERAWVYQESVLAREIVVKTGSFEIPGSSIVSMAECGRQYGMSYIGSKNAFALDRTYAMFLPLKGRPDFGCNFWQDLFWALRARRGSKTSDPRDIIYSLLGVAAGGMLSAFVPNYDRSWQQLYIFVAKKIIEETHNLDILGELTAVPTDCICAPKALPSWVPDWRVALDEAAKFSIISNIEGGPKPRIFYSTGLSAVSLNVGGDQFSSELRLHGIHVDVVESIQPSGCWTKWKEFHQFLTETIYWPTQEPMPLARLKMLNFDEWHWNPNNPDYVPKGVVECVKDYGKYLRGGKEEKKEADLAIMSELTRSRRKVILTSRGFFGVAPQTANVGDNLYLLPGSEFPVLLRRYQKEKIGNEFIGECYIHGLMNGQGMKMACERDNPPNNFSADNDSGFSKFREGEMCLVTEEILIC
ncbi:heterokaryon incompatibility protein-domain-containing protein [Hyaloscypha sp. PMI_1271]|nr:heterokaryon incompatibility protein-domain-containing protein [Hyaloscypha sp. PMI_1271]